MDVDKYYGRRQYQLLKGSMIKEMYTENEKLNMMKEIVAYIGESDYRLYHDFMDDIAVSHQEWFNMLVFDKRKNKVVLELIKSNVNRRRGKTD